MTNEEFTEAVRQMRHNQKRYRATGRYNAFEESERWEKVVDAHLREVREHQLNIFDKTRK